jgi:methyl-accepting chemotaxis protein
MKPITLQKRLILACAAFTLMLILSAGYAVWALNKMQERFADFATGVSLRLNTAHQFQEAVNKRAIAARNLVLVNDAADIEMEKKVVTEAHASTTATLATLMDLTRQPGVPEETRSRIAELARLEALYAPVALGIVDLALKGDREEATRRLIEDCRPLLADLTKATEAYTELAGRHTTEKLAAAQSALEVQRAWLLALCAVVVAGTLLGSYFLVRGLMRSLGADPEQLRDAVNRVASGDLTETLQLSSKDHSSVMAALKNMQESFGDTVSQVRGATESINVASSEIAAGNHDLSARTEQAASNLEETAASMEELTSTVGQSADAARQANQLAASASEVAVRGGQVVSQVVTTMEEINHSSKKISDIIGVIDGIAFQTNILALNAAVEAARAGEQGRGFAVVAAEVRTLAQRSAEAAKEIKGLIGTSVDKVDAGSRLVADAGQTMSEIVGSVQRVTDIIGEITAASGDQGEGIAQVNTAVNQLDQMTQQNAALVEESAAAASSLRDQAMRLVQVVQVFRCRDALIPSQSVPEVRRLAAAPSRATPTAQVVQARPNVAQPLKSAALPLAKPAAPDPLPRASSSPAKAKPSDEGDWESF